MIGCDTFDAFALPVTPFTVSPSELDPYIARFVKAVNEIGVKTVMSCDGWHQNQDIGIRQVRLWMADRYSVHWLWLITEFVFGEKWIREFTNDEKMMEEADAMSFMEMHRKIQAIVEEDLVALKWNCNV